MAREYGQITPYLKGKTVFVIGGGPSLIDFDFDVLSGYEKIGANDAGRLTDAGTVVTLDRNYYRHRVKDLKKLAEEGRTVYAALPDNMPNVDFPEEITFLRFRRGHALSSDPGMLYGLNSGFTALNVAYLAGATDIRLIGFDFKFLKGSQHWHKEHHWFSQKSDRQLRRWAKDFDTTLSQLRAAGAEVTNYVGPDGSEVAAFPTKPLTDLAQ